MILPTEQRLADLFEADETAWLESMAELIETGNIADLDYSNLREYLTDMALRDRREVESRLATLLAHLLKWDHQPDHRSNSWRGTIVTQRRELRQLLESGSLRVHAGEVLTQAYQHALDQAAAETGLERILFQTECPWTLDELMASNGN